MTTENLFLLLAVLLSDVAYLRKALRKGAAHARELTCTFGLDRHRYVRWPEVWYECCLDGSR